MHESDFIHRGTSESGECQSVLCSAESEWGDRVVAVCDVCGALMGGFVQVRVWFRSSLVLSIVSFLALSRK